VHKVKILGNYYRGDLHDYFERMSQGEGRWNDIQLVEQGEDTLVMINWVRGLTPKDAVIFQMEPSSSIAKFPGIFRNISGNRDKIGFGYDTKTYRNTIEWHISPNYSQLRNEEVDLTKTKEMSSIMSSVRTLDGHKMRLELLCYLCDNMELDAWGKGHSATWIHPESPSAGREMGSLPFREKDRALFPYKYTYAAENTYESNYFTEKLVDAILSECLCFYWGCPNLHEFIDSRAYIPITVRDHEHSLNVIKCAIANNEWEKRLPYIKAAKQKILDELQLFPTLENILKIQGKI
tara:strand:- start:691 stop:1569 length:879 start_codon:yes stop_codon:yes gene_type:complete